MGGPYDALPFPRGQSYGQGISTSLVTKDANFGKNLAGNIYRVRDEYCEGNVKLLRVVQNLSGTTMTMTHRCVPFLTTDYTYFGRLVDDSINAAGDVCKPIDDYYAETFTVPSFDLFYVVERGRCKVNRATGGGTGHPAQTLVYADSDGKVTETSAGFAYAVGRSTALVGDSDTTEVIEVIEGLD